MCSGYRLSTAILVHRILWEDGIYRCDINPSNLVFYRTSRGRVIGVLNDYDLSSIQDDCPRGNDHTGTVPLLSIGLFTLLSTVEGSVEHVYRHDVESLVWVSVRVCFRYEDGKPRKNKPLCEWLGRAHMLSLNATF